MGRGKFILNLTNYQFKYTLSIDSNDMGGD